MTIKQVLATVLLLSLASLANANCLPENATPADVRSSLNCMLDEPAPKPDIAQTDQLSFWQMQVTSFSELASTYESSGLPSLTRVSKNLKARAELAVSDMQRLSETGNKCDLAAFKDNTWFWGSGLRLNRINTRSNLQAPGMAGCASTAEISAISLVDQIQAACESAESCDQGLAAARPMASALKEARGVGRENSKNALSTLQQQIIQKDEDWNRYLFESKPLWPWELALTDWWHDRYDDTYSQGFRRPPPKQIIFMHPSVGAEWIDKAPEGERFAPTIYVEVVGVNYWDDGNRWLNDSWLSSLSGASLAVTLTDRPGINTVGAGPLLTFDNTFEIGINYYGESQFGIMVGLNLMKLWKDDYEKRVRRLKETIR